MKASWVMRNAASEKGENKCTRFLRLELSQKKYMKKRKVISMSFMSIEKICERMKRSALLWEGTSAM